MTDPRQCPNPFPGLRSFTHEEEAQFFGREIQRNELLRRLTRHRLIAVLGGSGSGKSSLVHAGVLPALSRGFKTRHSDQWRIAVMTPGNNPIGRLAAALARSLDQNDTDDAMRAAMIETTLRRSALGLVEAIRQARGPGNVLVFVDQFEELFRVASELRVMAREDHATAFVRLLLEASRQTEQPIYIILTMRSDYLGDCARFPGLPEALNSGQYLVPRMTREQRRSIIVKPIELRHAHINQPLVNRLLNDVGDNPDQLPILQHALLRTWDYWARHAADNDSLGLAHYEAIGTLNQALERHADEAYNELPDDTRRHIAEKMFKRLTEKNRDGRERRNPTTVADICAVAAVPLEQITPVIDCFRQPGRSFLVTGKATDLTPDTVVDITHEALIRVWSRLRRWADEETNAAEDYLRLAERAMRHNEVEDFLRQPALQLALDWRERTAPNVAWARRYHPGFDTTMAFIDASVARDNEEREKAEAARRREMEQAYALAEEQRRAARRLKLLAVALTALVLSALLMVVFTYFNSLRTKAQERTVAALSTLERAPLHSIELALEAVATIQPLANALPNATNREVAQNAQSALNRALQTAQDKLTLGGHCQAVTQALFSGRHGEALISLSRDGRKRHWDVAGLLAHRTPAPAMDDDACEPNPHAERLAVVSVDLTGQHLATGDNSGGVSLSTASEQRTHTLRGHDGGITAIAFDRMGRLLATASRDHTARLWDVVTGQLLHDLTGHGNAVIAVAFSPDGNTLATASWDRTARLWDVASGALLHELSGHRAELTALAFSPDGSTLVTAGWDTTARLWNVRSGQIIDTLVRHQAAVTTLAFNAPGNRLATGGRDGLVNIWALNHADQDNLYYALLYELRGHRGAITDLLFNNAGDKLVTAGWDGTARVWNMNTGDTLITRDTHGGPINTLALFDNDNANLLAAGSEDSRLTLWTLEPGQTLRSQYYTFAPDFAMYPQQPDNRNGVELIAAIDNGMVHVIDAKTSQTRYVMPLHSEDEIKIAFKKDGKRLATLTANDQLREYYLDTDDLTAAARRLLPQR